MVEEVEERNNAGSAKHKETWTSLRVRTLMTCNVCLQKTAVYWAVYEKSSGKDVALRGCRVKKNTIGLACQRVKNKHLLEG